MMGARDEGEARAEMEAEQDFRGGIAEEKERDAPPGDFFGEMDVIHGYGRAEAIEDGTLVDVTELARKYGFRAPVAFTREAWTSFVGEPYAEPASGLESVKEAERLGDVLHRSITAVFRAIAKDPKATGRIPVIFGDRPAEGGAPAELLHLHLGPGDEGEMVFTLMLPGED